MGVKEACRYIEDLVKKELSEIGIEPWLTEQVVMRCEEMKGSEKKQGIKRKNNGQKTVGKHANSYGGKRK